MARRLCWVVGVAIAIAWILGPLATETFAQEEFDISDLGNKVRPGGYLSLLKIGLVAGVFLVWVKLADWINLDALRFGKKSGLSPEVWNPIVVLCFLIPFVAVISVPLFWATYPVFVISTFTPPLIYFFVRKKKMKESPSLARMVGASKGKSGAIEIKTDPLPQDEGAEVDFTAAGADKTQKQANLIRARQSGGFTKLKDLIYDAQFKRTEQLMLDYTQTAVGIRILVDGAWHPLESMEREVGDQLLVSLKCLSAANPADRRSKQTGSFNIKSEHGKGQIDFMSQGVATGERVLLKFIGGVQDAMPLEQLGMFPEMLQVVKQSMNTPGITIISSPPGQGFTSSWQGALLSSDRLTRDCIALVLPSEQETRVENIMPKEYDPNLQSQYETLRATLLTQPDMIAVPKVEDKQTMDLLVSQALTQQRSIMFRTPARSAAEGLLRVYSQSGDRAEFLKAMSVVTCQRLARRLCPTCRVEVQVQPQLIQQLGGDPRTQTTLFNQYQLPPPEMRVDENGQPVEIPPCATCGGIGYIGRIAIFEMIEMNDQLRQFVQKNPQAAAIEKAAVKLGKKTMAAQAYQLVLLGVTSLAEVQRVLKSG